MSGRYDHIRTFEEADAALGEMSSSSKLLFEAWWKTYRAVAAESPGKKVSPKRVLQLMGSTSASTFYLYLPLMKALASGSKADAEAPPEEGHEDYKPSAALVGLLAPLQENLRDLPEKLDRLLASTIAGEIERFRGAFAQERFTLTEDRLHAEAYAQELEADIQVLVKESSDLRTELAATCAEKRSIEEKLGLVTADLLRANGEIKEQVAVVQVMQARITGLVDLGEAHFREVTIVKAEKDAQMKRADKAEDENRELRQLREQDIERSKMEMADLQARHAAELAALRQEFSRDVAVERDRVSKLELALVNALGTAVDANAARKEPSHV